MQVSTFVIFAIAFINLVLASFVYLRNPKRRINQIFGAFALAISLWMISNHFVDNFDNLQVAEVWMRVTFISSALIIYLLMLFVLAFPDNGRSLNKRRVILLFLPTGLITSLLFTDLIIAGVKPEARVIGAVFGSLGFVFSFYFLSYLLVALGILFSKYRRSRGLERVQLQYIFFGLFLSSIILTVTNLIMPFVFNNYGFVNIGPLALLFFLGFIAYAIVKHRFMDIRLVVARSVAYVFMVAILAILYSAGIITANSYLLAAEKPSLPQNLIYIALAIVVGLSFHPLKQLVNKKTDRLFFKDRYNPGELLDTISHALGSTIILSELLYKVLNLLMANMKIDKGAFILLKEDGNSDIQALGYKTTPKLGSNELAAIVRNKTLVLDELEYDSGKTAILKKIEASVVVPLIHEKKTTGLLVLGGKLSGDIYTREDLQVLEIISPQAAIAIQNAKAYEEIRGFNIKLKEEVKKATFKLRDAYEKLKDIDKTKDDFIFMASHQLRTPVTSTKGWLSMIQEGDFGKIPAELKDPIDNCYQNTEHIAQLIAEFLTVSRMNAGTLKLNPEPTDLKQIVDACVNEISVSAKERELDLEYIKPDNLIPEVNVDPKMTREVAMNFLTNAVNYTPKGFIRVELCAEKDEVVFKVTDSGIGVPESAKKELFGKFVRAENAKQVRPDGNGLGLHLAKYVIEQSNGKIIFESEEGKGSAFGFRVPVNSANTGTAKNVSMG